MRKILTSGFAVLTLVGALASLSPASAQPALGVETGGLSMMHRGDGTGGGNGPGNGSGGGRYGNPDKDHGDHRYGKGYDKDRDDHRYGKGYGNEHDNDRGKGYGGKDWGRDNDRGGRYGNNGSGHYRPL